MNERYYISLTAFDIARLGTDELYRMAEERVGIPIPYMKLRPDNIDGDYVEYEIIIENKPCKN